MSLIVWTNNASSTLASGITNVATQFTVQAGQGALYPNPTAGQYFMVTLEDVSGNIEITKCTGRTGDTLTIVRAQESTSALPFASGSRAEVRVTAGVLATLLQKTGDTLSDGTLSGILTLGGGGSIRNGEYAGGAIRGTPGDTTNQIIVPAGGGNPYIGASSTNPILTKGNLTANLPSGTALVVTGCILAWYGSVGTIPAGYVLCDGTAGTPDLRGQFIIGAGQQGGVGANYPQGSTGGSPNTGLANGAATVTGTYTLTIADIPAHGHAVNVATSASGGGFPGVGFLTSAASSSYVTNNTGAIPFVQQTGGAGSHSHTIGSVSHQHTCLPPYRALVMIMKS